MIGLVTVLLPLANCCSSDRAELPAGQALHDQIVAEGLGGEELAEGDAAVRRGNDVGAHAGLVGEGDLRAASFRRAGRGEMGVGDQVAEHGLARPRSLPQRRPGQPPDRAG